VLSPFRRPAVSAGLIVLALGAASACGSSSSGGGGGGAQTVNPASSPSNAASSGADPALVSLVPAAIKAKGTLTVGTDSTYAPSEFLDTDGKTIIGFDVDLFNAVAKKLGLKANFQTANFDSIITGVNAKKYDIGVSSFTVNKDREKQAVMVSYFQAGTQWATKTGNPTHITPDTACGKHVAVQKATVEVDDLTARSKKCTQSGKPAIGIDQYTAQDAATAAAVAGKDDAVLADSPVMAYAVKQTNGQLQLLGSIYDSAPYGYVLPKSEKAFGKAVVGALKDVMTDGTYTAVLKKWGVTQGAITDPAVNPKVSS
jgi:polar amino acid transport system substrate-binding protein